MSSAAEPTSLVEQLERTEVPAGHVMAWWLGGSGFIFKTPAGTQIYIDPYLSNCVESIFGSSRAFPAPIEPEQVRADAVISSHWHEDHLDPGSIPVIAQHSPRTRFIMPPTATSHALSWMLPRDRVTGFSAGDSLTINEVTITAVPARHEAGIPGWAVPDAIGILLEVEGLCLYHTGDTEYDVRLRNLRERKIDVVMACINGVTGNMDAHEAALLAWQLGVGTAIPIHHILWAGKGDPGATLDPALFAETYRKLGGSGRVILPEVGQPILLSR